ncbi:hypothetical protein M0802_003618 [Mischocyttarus mexicanus]|nr:hypothetical protein M0802_003618 [Mischocyttarus mexicanus]
MEMNADLGDDGSESSQSSSEGSSASSTFCNLESDYARIMKEMKTNDALAAFEDDYRRLYEFLYKSHKNEKELTEKCSSLTTDAIEISKLKQDIEKALKLADAAHTREQNAQEVIDNLRLNITKLMHEIEVKNKQLAGEDESGVSQQREGLLREREKLLGEMETLKERLKNMSQYTNELEMKNITAEQKIVEIQEILDIRTSEVSREKRAKERMEEDFNQLEEELVIKTEDLHTTNEALRNAIDNVKKLENTLKDHKVTFDKTQKELGRLSMKNLNLQTDLENANVQIDILDKDISDKEKQIRNLKNEFNRANERSIKSKSDKDILEKRFLKIDYERNRLEQELKQATTNMKNVDYEMGIFQKQQFEHKQQYEALMREKNILARNNENLKGQVRNLDSEMTVINASRKKLEHELNNGIYREAELNKKIETIEKERDKCNFEVRKLMHRKIK